MQCEQHGHRHSTIDRANVPYFRSHCILQLEKVYDNEILTDLYRRITLYSSAFFPARETIKRSVRITFGSMVAVGCKALDHYNRFNSVFFQFSNYMASTMNKNINKPYCNSPFAFLNDNYPLDLFYTKVTRGTYSLFRTEFFSTMAT